MKKINRKWLIVLISVIVTACILWLINYLAVTYCIEKLKLFTALVLVVPTVCIAIAAFLIGYQIKWNCKRGICISLVLTLISFGMSQIAVVMAGDKLDNIGTEEILENTQNTYNDELVGELYEELDKKAYEYMLSQGLISEGEEIYGGEGTIGGIAHDNSEKNDDTFDEQIVNSKLYVGIHKSDPATEFIGNVMTFFVALFFSFAGNVIRAGKCDKKRRIE